MTIRLTCDVCGSSEEIATPITGLSEKQLQQLNKFLLGTIEEFTRKGLCRECEGIYITTKQNLHDKAPSHAMELLRERRRVEKEDSE